MEIISGRGRKIAGSEFEFRAALSRWRCDRWWPVTVAVGAAKRQTVTVDPRRGLPAPWGRGRGLGRVELGWGRRARRRRRHRHRY
eukprot:scaffold137666_cov78-Phaeocystis_antarctica.AAC.1